MGIETMLNRFRLPVLPPVARRVIDRPGTVLCFGVLPSRAGERIPTSEHHCLRGTCPKCRGPVVANMYNCGALRGYLLRYECWAALMPDTAEGTASTGFPALGETGFPTCDWYDVP